MFTEEVYTVEEVARHLRVPVEAIQKEITSGRLHATKVAEYLRVRESDLNAFKSGSRTESRPVAVSGKIDGPVLEAVPNFFHTWPNKRKEHFSNAREGVTVYGGTNYQVKLGFTKRDSAG
jgi:excisionase family DNA binding protein